MAFRYGFFDSEITGYDEEGMPQFDRAESSDFLALFIASIIRSGVLAVPGDNFQVLAGEGMNLLIRPGFGVVQGRFAYDDEESFLALPEADTKNRRIDRVILRANYPDRKCEILVRAGVPSAEPQPPELLRTSGDYYELCLAEVSIRANQSMIVQADITDTRADTDLCGWVTQAIDQVDTHTLFLQWQDAYQRYYDESTAEFEAWLDGIKAQLGEDVVGVLLESIKKLDLSKADRKDLDKLQMDMTKEMETLRDSVSALDKNKPNKARVFQTVITASKWTGEVAPFENRLPVESVTTASIIDIGVAPTVSTEQVKAWMAGLFVDGGQEEGIVKIKAFGRKPEVDIPVTVTIRGDA